MLLRQRLAKLQHVIRSSLGVVLHEHAPSPIPFVFFLVMGRRFPPTAEYRIMNVYFPLEKFGEFIRLREYVVGLSTTWSLTCQDFEITSEVIPGKGHELLAALFESRDDGVIQLLGEFLNVPARVRGVLDNQTM